MEVEAHVQSVLTAATLFAQEPGGHEVQLLRDLEILIGMASQGKCLGFFQKDEMLPTNCLAALTEIIDGKNTSSNLVEKIVLLFTYLAEEEEVRKMLHLTFNVSKSLAELVMGEELSHGMTVECVKLLQQVTYHCHSSFQEPYVEELVSWLMSKIKQDERESDLNQPCLGLLANLCRDNFAVQMCIKNKDDFRSFCKILINNLSGVDTVAICSLSILFSICFTDDLGGVVFKSQNVNQTFQLMFNIVNGNQGTARRCAVDLFVDLLKHSKIQSRLVKYKNLKPAVQAILNILRHDNAEAVAKLVELLLAFCAVNGLRGKVVECLVQSAEVVDGKASKKPVQALCYWATQSSCPNTPLFALDLLREVYQECIDSGVSRKLHPSTDQLLAGLNRVLTTSSSNVLQTEKALHLLLTLCNSDDLKPKVATAADSPLCSQIIEEQINKCYLHKEPLRDDYSSDCDMQARIVIYTLELMRKSGLEENLHEILQDTRLIPFLAYGMRSERQEQVDICLRLLSTALQLQSFPVAMLANRLASQNSKSGHNKRKSPVPSNKYNSTSFEKENSHSTHSDAGKSDSLTRPALSTKSAQENAVLDSSVQNLIDRMQSGLELKDLKSSELFHVYEHKIRLLETRESHVQDLLEAKTKALSHADHMLTQYRCQLAQAEAESHKLRSMLHDLEKRTHENQEKLHQLNTEKTTLEQQLRESEHECQRLETIADEFDELAEQYREQSAKLENMQRLHTTLKQENARLCELQEIMKKHNETLKEQHDIASQQLAQYEEKAKSLSSHLRDREDKITDLNQQLKQTKENLEFTSKERDEFEETLESFRMECSKRESELKAARQQVNKLEILTRQHEASLKEKDAIMESQKVQLEKLASVQSMICSLVQK